MTTEGTAVTSELQVAHHRPLAERNFYFRLWAGVPRELVFLLLGLPIATAGFAVTLGLFDAGVGTLIPLFVGVFVLIGAMYVARGFGTLELTRLDWANQPPIKRTDWQDPRAAEGFWSWLRSVLLNGHYWLALLHTMVINFVVALFSWTVIVSWIASGLGGITYWFWERFIPRSENQLYISQWLFAGRGFVPTQAAYEVSDSILYLVLGLICLATLPFIARGLIRMHWGIAYGVLGPWKSETLSQQVHDLNIARGAASSAEGHSLRRLERDIHDGPQQRLVRMQMDLAAADRQLGDDPDKARTLIAEAMQQSKDALEELRALSRGFAPPILLDRGLVAALESAATRSPIPTRVVDKLPARTKLPQEIERNAYFAASEALTNAIKHSGATEIDIRVSKSENSLVITVSDNGSGGAVAIDGHGLAGLDERMRGSGGTLEVHSPSGGPTLVSARLPLG
ncbi:MAG TPA: sensor histidine kinase [Galbitalea sp.]|jgi:signal transduction histidine kinase|nr:sensor histidine kinase [Galbitalea sp.]